MGLINFGNNTTVKVNGEVMVSENGTLRPANPAEVEAYEAQRAQYDQARAAYKAERAQRKAQGTAGPDIVIGDIAGRRRR